jgi:hypothetical protein
MKDWQTKQALRMKRQKSNLRMGTLCLVEVDSVLTAMKNHKWAMKAPNQHRNNKVEASNLNS